MNWGSVWLVAGAVALGAPTANAQYIVRGPGVIVASDIDAPYDDVGPPLPPRYAPGPAPYSEGPRYAPPPYAGESYGPSAYGAPMLPPGAILRIARQNGFSPVGDPQPRGPVYRLAVIGPDGDDGRLIIDARTGRILRFVPASDYGSRFDRSRSLAAAPVGALPPMADAARTSLRPPSSVAPRIAAPTTVAALPKPAAPAAPRAASAAPRRQADLHQAVPPAPPAALASVAPPQLPPAAVAPAAVAPAEKPATDMPPAQGLE